MKTRAACLSCSVTALLLANACASEGAHESGVDPSRDPAPKARPVPAPTGSTPDQMRPINAVEGALEIGDPYFPGLGNGGYDVEHYALEIDLDLAQEEIKASATLRARALEDLASFSLDLYGLEVQRVLVDGKPASFERPAAVPAPDGKSR